uniref:Uncharacterized protein n=1 Tax=Oryza barthii TaxID=65489 RepID=A0A0D3G256_9ORYZ
MARRDVLLPRRRSRVARVAATAARRRRLGGGGRGRGRRPRAARGVYDVVDPEAGVEVWWLGWAGLSVLFIIIVSLNNGMEWTD